MDRVGVIGVHGVHQAISIVQFGCTLPGMIMVTWSSPHVWFVDFMVFLSVRPCHPRNHVSSSVKLPGPHPRPCTSRTELDSWARNRIDDVVPGRCESLFF